MLLVPITKTQIQVLIELSLRLRLHIAVFEIKSETSPMCKRVL